MTRSKRSAEPQFEILSAAEFDLRALAVVQSRAINEAYPSVFPDVFDSRMVTPERLESELRDLWEQISSRGRIYKATVESDIVGICVAGEDSVFDSPNTGYIQRVYVDPEWWNIGVGDALVRCAEEYLRDCGFKRVALQLLENNTRAKHFYEKRGWKFEQKIRMKDVGIELRYVKDFV